jgi:hypothetical protein
MVPSLAPGRGGPSDAVEMRIIQLASSVIPDYDPRSNDREDPGFRVSPGMTEKITLQPDSRTLGGMSHPMT